MSNHTPFLSNLLLAATAQLHAAGSADQCGQVLGLAKLTPPPAVHAAEGFAAQDGLKPLFYEALPWKGKPTRVFAWLGFPKQRTGKVPGVVLVHGGGGTAFPEWVRKWNGHGFAAISIAVEGQTDEKDATAQKGALFWKQHAWAGPPRIGIYGDSDQPLADQWMYHAVADTVLANSLLRSLPEVDAEKVGVMGISWGGVITSTVIGIDSRLAFAIPTYGCGHLFDADNQYARALANNTLYREVWDPMMRMVRVKMPVLWFSWPEDQHFPLDCQAACYRVAPGPHMVSLLPGMKHGHSPAYDPPDSYAFAQSIVGEGLPWCMQTSTKLEAGGHFHVEFSSAKPLDRATLISTTGHGFTGNRPWIKSAAALEKRGAGWFASATIPAGTTGWFVNVHSGKLTASSDYHEQK